MNEIKGILANDPIMKNDKLLFNVALKNHEVNKPGVEFISCLVKNENNKYSDLKKGDALSITGNKEVINDKQNNPKIIFKADSIQRIDKQIEIKQKTDFEQIIEKYSKEKTLDINLLKKLDKNELVNLYSIINENSVQKNKVKTKGLTI